jgi:hypothetical protein
MLVIKLALILISTYIFGSEVEGESAVNKKAINFCAPFLEAFYLNVLKLRKANSLFI